jgi:hypothetical protein
MMANKDTNVQGFPMSVDQVKSIKLQQDNEGYYSSIDKPKANQLYKRNLYNLQH